LGIRELRDALPLTGGLAETSVLIVIGYLAGLLLQGVGQAITERVVKWWWGGFPSERWLLTEDRRLTAEYKAQLSEATSRRFGLALDLSSPVASSAADRKARMKRNQEIFYRCYRSVEKASEQPQTFNAQYGLFRGLLTTFLVLAFLSLGVVAHGLWVARTVVASSYLFFAGASIVGGVISYQRTKKRAEDFAKAVLDVFLVANAPPSPGPDAGPNGSKDRKETTN
jgi:hypothetical protein